MNVAKHPSLGLGLRLGCCIAIGIAPAAHAQAAPPLYPQMAALELYLPLSADDDIALARSAAPASISGDAEILVFDRGGYHSAVKGSNGFTCLVERSWIDEFQNPEFWNPKIRVPICLNGAASRSVLPAYLERTKWALEGKTLIQMRELWKDHPPADPELGSMAIMMSKYGNLADGVGAAVPHVMFYLPGVAEKSWAPNLPSSPFFTLPTDTPSITIFYSSVPRWSDGTRPESPTAANPPEKAEDKHGGHSS